MPTKKETQRPPCSTARFFGNPLVGTSLHGMFSMTPKMAGSVASRARKLLRCGKITRSSFVILDCILWSCRPPGSDRTAVSYSRLQKLACASRETVSKAISSLERYGLLRKIKRRVRVAWGTTVVSRQATNLYVLLPPTESTQSTVYPGQVSNQASPAIERALGRLQAAIRERSG